MAPSSSLQPKRNFIAELNRHLHQDGEWLASKFAAVMGVIEDREWLRKEWARLYKQDAALQTEYRCPRVARTGSATTSSASGFSGIDVSWTTITPR